MTSRKKTLNLVIIAVFFAWFITVSFMPLEWFIQVPKLRFTQTQNRSIPISTSQTSFVISYETIVTFSAIGSFSVNNPVTVDITIKNANVSNFLAFFQGYIFSYAYSYPLEYEKYGNMKSGEISLSNSGNGEYRGTGQLIWLQEGSTWLLPLPYNPPVYSLAQFQQSGDPVVYISGVSDTLATTFSESTAKLAWQLSAFSVIVLQPVLEAILLKEPKPK